MTDGQYEEGSQGQEEEYHFTDEEPDYDLSNAATSAGGDVTAASAAPKKSFAEHIRQHRRILAGIVIFMLVLGIVYRLLVPAAPPVPQTEITRAVSQTSAKKPVVSSAVQSPVVVPPQVVVSPVASVTPAVSALPEAAAVPATASAPNSQGNIMAQLSALADRVATLEQQNSAMANLLQTQYAQKLSGTEMQNSELHTQVQELASRLSTVEVAFHQLTKMLANEKSRTVSHMARTAERGSVWESVSGRADHPPRIGYSVQAIIPGRAWLRSDSGDTVTVAEGDMLRGLGRIVRIDPYDGIVKIATGTKIITLSYGTNDD
jgi:hypothetical protein